MKILIISPSTMPTYCGVGKFSDAIAKAFLTANKEVLVLGKENQLLTSNLEVKTQYPVELMNLSFGNTINVIKRIKDYNPDKIIIQFNSAEIGKNFFLSFFPYFIKLSFIRSKLFSVIHEFNSYTIKGKIRHLVPMFISNQVLFSDQVNMDSAMKYLPFKKSEVIKIGPQVGNNFIKPSETQTNIVINNILNKTKLKIGFHGLIQPKNNLFVVLDTLKQLNEDKTNFEFHILGAFKLLFDYGDMNEEVKKYQESILNKIKEYNLTDKIIIHGDIDPFSLQFQAISKELDIVIFPDQDGTTTRRTSFWNLFVQSPSVCLVSKSNNEVEDIFDNFVVFDILEENDLYHEITKLLNSNSGEIAELIKKQNMVRLEYSPTSLNKYYNELVEN